MSTHVFYLLILQTALALLVYRYNDAEHEFYYKWKHVVLLTDGTLLFNIMSKKQNWLNIAHCYPVKD